MKISHNLKQFALAMAVGAVTTGAMAANQGVLGSTSEGDFDVTYNKGTEVRIWGLEDVSFDGDTNDLTAGDLVQGFSFCTFSNNTDEVVFDVESDNTDFTLQSGANTLPYNIALSNNNSLIDMDRWGDGWLASGVQGSYRYLTQSNVSGGASTVCGVQEQTTDLVVTIPQQNSVEDGVYTDTVTLTIRPI